MGFNNRQKIGSDFFRLFIDKNNDIELDYYLKQFNINDYYIFKVTSNSIQVSVLDFLKLNYCGYMFFHKNKYKLDDILNWIDFLKKHKLSPPYITKPFPDVSIMKKINILL